MSKPVIVRDIEQGTEEWLDLRKGVATASNFDRIITGKTLKPSATATAYRHEVISDYLGADDNGIDQTPWMARGHELEPQARSWFELETGIDIEEVGFIFRDENRQVGCSPDGINEEHQIGLEIKCPMGKTHVSYLLDGGLPTKYICQVYGSLFVTGFKEWHFISYHPSPELKMFHVVVSNRDPAYVSWASAFAPLLEKFLNDKERDISILQTTEV